MHIVAAAGAADNEESSTPQKLDDYLTEESQSEFNHIKSTKTYNDVMEFQKAARVNTGGCQSFLQGYGNRPTYNQQIEAIIVEKMTHPEKGHRPYGFWIRKANKDWKRCPYAKDK